MNFFSTIIYGYFVLAGYIIYTLNRDRKNSTVFFGQHKILTWSAIAISIGGALLAFDAHFIEPWTIKTTPVEIKISGVTTSIKIAFVSDIQVGNDKKTAWVEKIVERVNQEKPNLVILGGDQINNTGTFEDESRYLEPLRALADKYPAYAVLGNHEYGIGSGAVGFEEYYTGNRSAEVIERLKNLGIKLLRNDLDCPEIRGQKICLFGIDDVWGGQPNFDALTHYPPLPRGGEGESLSPPARGGVTPPLAGPGWWENPLIFLTHNPDGIKLWPKNLRAPDLVLAGHTHGGQVWIPFLGPLGNAGISLPTKYYRGLNYVSLRGVADDEAIPSNEEIASPSARNDIPIYTSTGIGESGGAVRFWTLPEIVIITLTLGVH